MQRRLFCVPGRSPEAGVRSWSSVQCLPSRGSPGRMRVSRRSSAEEGAQERERVLAREKLGMASLGGQGWPAAHSAPTPFCLLAGSTASPKEPVDDADSKATLGDTWKLHFQQAPRHSGWKNAIVCPQTPFPGRPHRVPFLTSFSSQPGACLLREPLTVV